MRRFEENRTPDNDKGRAKNDTESPHRRNVGSLVSMMEHSTRQERVDRTVADRLRGVDWRPKAIAPNLLTGDGMTYSADFKRRLESRPRRSILHPLSSQRQALAYEMLTGIEGRCDNLLSMGYGNLPPSFVKSFSASVRLDSQSAYQRITQSGKGQIRHETRERACEILSTQSDRLEVLNFALKKQKGKLIDNEIVERAYTDFESDFSKTPSELNYKALTVITDDAVLCVHKIETYLKNCAEYPEVQEAEQEIIPNINIFKAEYTDSVSWATRMIYPKDKITQDFNNPDEWYRNKCHRLLKACKDIKGIDKGMEKRFPGPSSSSHDGIPQASSSLMIQTTAASSVWQDLAGLKFDDSKDPFVDPQTNSDVP